MSDLAGLHCLGCGDDTHELAIIATSPSSETPDSVGVLICADCLDGEKGGLLDRIWQALCMRRVKVIP